jgi:outer membrane protein W
VGFEMNLLRSQRARSQDVAGVGDARFNGRTHELSAGGRWLFEPLFGEVRPYIGVGLSSIWAHYDSAAPGQGANGGHAWTPGAYGHAGLTWAFAEHFSAGIDYRKELFTRVHLDSVQTNANYSQVAITLGYSF